MGYKANISSNLINQLLRIVIGGATSIIVARVLGPTGQGYIAYIILVFMLIGDFGHFGLNNSTMYFKKRSAYDPNHLFNVNVTALGLIFLVISALVLLLRSTGIALTGYNYLYVFGGLVFVASDLFFTSLHSWYVGDERILESNRYIITVFLVKSALILILWLAGFLTPLTFFGATVLGMLLNALYLARHTGQKYTPAIDTRLLKAEFSYGGVLWLGAIFSFLYFRADQFMIKGMLGISDLGVYSIAVVLAELLFLVPVSINSALLGKLYNIDKPSLARGIMARTLKLTLYVSVALALVGIPLCLLIPAVYGQAYSGAVLSTMILLAGAVFASVAKVAMQYFFTLGRPKVHLYSSLATLAVNVTLNFILIPRYGITGAAIASAISYLGYGLFYIAMFRFREGFSFRDMFQLTSEDLQALWKKA
ncbi:MAG: polysaccharide biosynthesis C-terminal domain-containing protein [Candidatus Syntrophosphaera sp.]|nr:polysaccharide biosynthesis C-terminal domain-containing protein [Candidatus Syntrophosphaera sp.]